VIAISCLAVGEERRRPPVSAGDVGTYPFIAILEGRVRSVDAAGTS
jgi:hypothetical protein